MAEFEWRFNRRTIGAAILESAMRTKFNAHVMTNHDLVNIFNVFFYLKHEATQVKLYVLFGSLMFWFSITDTRNKKYTKGVRRKRGFNVDI